MRRRLRLAIGGAVLLGVALGLAWTLADRPGDTALVPERISSSHLADVEVQAPAGAPVGLAAVVSGADGTGEAERTIGAALRSRGFIVLQLDLAQWRAALDRDTTPCSRPIVDVELLAKEAQRSLKGGSYLRPVLVGLGEGGTLTEAILARTFAATLGGGVALDPAGSVATVRPICDDKAPVAAPVPVSGGYAYLLPAKMQAQLTVVSAAPAETRRSPPPCGEEEGGGGGADGTTPLDPARPPPPAPPRKGEGRPCGPPDTLAPGAGPFAIERLTEADPARRTTAAVDAAAAIAAQDAGTGGLPLVDLPATGKTRAVAVFFSGDGGWRDIDKTIGEHLTRDGIHVVGLDALRYFWTDREPKTVAADVAAMLRGADPGGTLPVIVLGYSFGADLFPFSWRYLPASIRDRVQLIALLAPGRSTSFSVSVKGWLGYGGAHAVLPELATLPAERVLCVYGSKETDTTPCLDPSLAGSRRLLIDGGHHFDGDYPALARRIVEEARLGR